MRSTPMPCLAQFLTRYISVTTPNYVLKSQLLFFDAGFQKIATAKTTAGLTRAVRQGDVLTFAQMLGGCVISEGRAIEAVCVLTLSCELSNDLPAANFR